MATIPIAYFLWSIWRGWSFNSSSSLLVLYGLAIQLAMHTFVLVIFAALCLYFHFNSLPPLLPILSIRYHRFDGGKKSTIQKCLWAVLIGFITAGLIVFNFFVHSRVFFWEIGLLLEKSRSTSLRNLVQLVYLRSVTSSANEWFILGPNSLPNRI